VGSVTKASRLKAALSPQSLLNDSHAADKIYSQPQAAIAQAIAQALQTN